MKLNNSNPSVFWNRVKKTRGCWLWVGGKSGRYGSLSINGVGSKAHRFSYEMHKGVIPEGLCVCHTCDNPLCVNPKHLFIGTQKDNILDMVSKDRHIKPKGELNVKAKLTEKNVRFIRKHYKFRHPKFNQKALAIKFNVGYMCVQEVVLRKTWTHIP